MTFWICSGDQPKKECPQQDQRQGNFGWHYDHYDKDCHDENHCFQLHFELQKGQFESTNTKQRGNGAKNTKGKGVLTKILAPR